MSALAVILNVAAAAAGFLAVRFAITRGPPQLIWGPFAAGGGLLAWTLFIYGRRVVFLGDYDEFWQGHARLLVAKLAGWVGIALYASAVAFVIYVRRREPAIKI